MPDAFLFVLTVFSYPYWFPDWNIPVALVNCARAQRVWESPIANRCASSRTRKLLLEPGAYSYESRRLACGENAES
ncbi:MAG: hypothetical protein DME65_13360, partial [Verrucomicrobia bacterium]